MIHHRIAEVIHTTLEFDLVEPPPEEFRAAAAEVVLFVPGWEWIGVGPSGTIVKYMPANKTITVATVGK